MRKILLTILLIGFIKPVVDKSDTNRCEGYYKVKIKKGNMVFYNGVKECYFEINEDKTIIKFGGMKKSDFHAEIEFKYKSGTIK